MYIMYLPILNKKHQNLRNNNADLSCDQKTTTGAYTMTGDTSGYLQTGLPFGKHLLGFSLDFDKKIRNNNRAGLARHQGNMGNVTNTLRVIVFMA